MNKTLQAYAYKAVAVSPVKLVVLGSWGRTETHILPALSWKPRVMFFFFFFLPNTTKSRFRTWQWNNLGTWEMFTWLPAVQKCLKEKVRMWRGGWHWKDSTSNKACEKRTIKRDYFNAFGFLSAKQFVFCLLKRHIGPLGHREPQGTDLCFWKISANTGTK